MTHLDAFQQLLDIMDRLLSPEGCPWDKKQTVLSIRASVVEEACELKEAIESGDNAHICEELGDLFFNAVFLSRLAEKEGRFTMDDALKSIAEKLIRRHPHVFGDAQVEDSDAVKRQWEEIKKSEKGKEHRKSILDGIPSGLHVLNRAQKVLKKIAHAGHPPPLSQEGLHTEEELADKLLSLVLEAELKGFDFEHAVRKKLNAIEAHFRSTEKK
jgi:MazG family protein